MKYGFDNNKYLKMQSEHIRERIAMFGNKLYLEFGGKLFDDYHASRVLPGFEPDSKFKMLTQLKDHAEIVVVISASSIESNKIRQDSGLTYGEEVIRLVQTFRGEGFSVRLRGHHAVRGTARGGSVPHAPEQSGHPLLSSLYHRRNTRSSVRNEYVETSRPLVVVTAPGPEAEKMATCLSQLYHEHKRGVQAGYAKFETFPIWNFL